MEISGLPQDYLKPLLPCFDLLQRCNMAFFDENNSFLKKYWRYSYVITSVIAYYLSLTAYALKIFKGQMELFELAYVLPVYIVCTQAFYWMNMVGSWQYILAPLFETLFRRYILGQESGLLLPFACSFPFNPSANWPTYIAVYLFETYSMFRIVYSYLGTEFLMITLCSHISTEFSLLSEDLLHLKTFGKIHKHCKMELRHIVIEHQKLIKFSEQLDGIFNKMIFVNISLVTITVCFFSFAAKVARGPLDMANNFMAVVALILPIFNLCYYAQLLIDSSTGIATSAYQNLWYLDNKEYQKSIWLIIRRSQKPCCLTSMKYNPIALHSFTTVLSTTWSYFSLTSSLYEDEK